MPISSHLSNSMRLLAVLGLLGLGGCEGVAKGVTEAVLDRQDKTDTRQCEIEGPAFPGVRGSLEAQVEEPGKTTKILMVHGISAHVPGYSSRFQKKLFDRLGLTVSDAQIKTIQLDSRDIAWKPGEPHELGTLRITRHTDAAHARQLVFYELTWSSISDAQKKLLDADSANNEGLPRADLNGTLKGFMNATVPDLLIYTGNGHDKITQAVTESVCWMLADDWDALPSEGAHDCAQWKGSSFAALRADDHFFVTHSLGSRITLDTIQKFARASRGEDKDPRLESVGRVVRDKEFSVFMLANQLPLLQMGRDIPDNRQPQATYCGDNAPLARQRVMKKMNIVAFSDPNDILSYPVPLDFTERNIDRRICPSVSNISLNVAPQKDFFDAVSFANPVQAHKGYLEDERVIDLIAEGLPLSDGGAARRCQWRRVE